MKILGSGIGRKFPFKQLYSAYMKTRFFPYKKERLKTIKIKDLKIKLFVKPSNGSIDQTIIARGKYETKITKIIYSILNEKSVFVDIGANIGYYSVLAGKKSRKGKVIAVEPANKTCKQLEKNIKINRLNNVKIVKKGTGKKKEKITISVDTKNIGHTSLVRKKFNSKKIRKEIVEIEKGDQILKNIKPDLIKIDVEGFELETLQGLEKTIKKYKPKIIIEVSPWIYEQIKKGEGQKRSKKIIEMLLNERYRLLDIDNNMIEINKNINIPQTNILAVVK